MHLVPGNLDELLRQQSVDVKSAPPPAGWWTLWKGQGAVRNMICVHGAWMIYIVTYYGMLLNIRTFSRDHLEINTVVAGKLNDVQVNVKVFLTLVFIRTIQPCAKSLECSSDCCWFFTQTENGYGQGFLMLWALPWRTQFGSFHRNVCRIFFAKFLVIKICFIWTASGDARVAVLMAISMVSKVAISSTLAMLTTCSTELVCDEKKKICAFSTVVWARIWLLTAPFVGATVVFGNWVPQTAMATLSIIGGFLTMGITSPRTIPKTKRNNLPTELSADVWTVNEHKTKIQMW